MSEPTRFCRHCGASIGSGAQFCASCGRSLTERQQASATKRRWIWVSLVVVVTLVVAAVVVLVVAGSDGDGEELVLQPLTDPGPDPFTESVSTADPAKLAAFAQAMRRAANPSSGNTAGVRAVSGSEPGLYGGSDQGGVCDTARLTGALHADRDRADAWARVQSISTDDIDDFVAGLAPAVIAHDTVVTNHSFSGGDARPFQAVLQAGTPVLVDEFGAPRVRCSCGNPLLAPSSSTDIRTVGDRWEGYDESQLQHVEPSTAPNEALQLVDLDSNEVVAVPVGDAARGFGDYLVIGDTGVLAASRDGETRPVLDGPIDAAHDDGRGGVVYTDGNSAGRSYIGSKTNTGVKWRRAGASQSEQLLSASGPDEYFDLHGVWKIGSTTWVVVTHVVNVRGEEIAGDLLAYNLDNGTVETISEDAVYATGGIGWVQGSADRLSYKRFADDIYSELVDLREGWTPAGSSWQPWGQLGPDMSPEPCEVPDAAPCPDVAAVGDDGMITVLTSGSSKPAQDLVVVDPNSAAVVKRIPVNRDFVGVPTMEVRGGQALISFLRLDDADPTNAIMVDLDSGALTELPYRGQVRFLRAPLRVTAPPAFGGLHNEEPVDLEQMRNMLLPPDTCEAIDQYSPRPEPLQLVDGEVPGFTTGTGFITASDGVRGNAAFGDLNDDGADDGVMEVSCNAGGNDVWFDVVYQLAGDQGRGRIAAEGLVTIDNGTRPRSLLSTSIQDGLLVVEWAVATGDDPDCCPSIVATGRFRIEGTRANLVDLQTRPL